MRCLAGRDWNRAPGLRWGGHDYSYFISLGWLAGRGGDPY
jgi:hypothetical protein